MITLKSIVEFKNVNDLLKSKNLYNNVGYWLKLFLTSAFLEVFHAAFKLVRSNPFLNFVQIFTRLLVVVLMIGYFESSKNCVGVLIVCLAWSITEVIRYFYYALNILGCVPYILTWLRLVLFYFIFIIISLFVSDIRCSLGFIQLEF